VAFLQRVHLARCAVQRLHLGKFTFSSLVALETLSGGDDCAPRQIELIAEEHHVGILPGVVTDACAPVDGTELATTDIPAELLPVILVTVSLIAFRPVWYVLVVEQRLLADDQT
jgi:hypothetical protein